MKPICSAAILAMACCSLPAQAEEPRFDIARYAIEGSSAPLPDEVARQAVQPYSGKQKSFTDAVAAARALEQAYRAAGQATVQVMVPEQKLADGVVMLRVIQPRLAAVHISGNRFRDEANILAALPVLRTGASPDPAALSQAAALANENPGRQVNVVLRGGANAEALNAEVEVKDDKPWTVTTTLDNTGSAQTGRTRLGVGLQHANLFNRDHVGSLQYQTSVEEPGMVHIWSFGYHVPLYGLGDSLDFTAGISNTNSGTSQTVAGPMTFTGKGDTFAARYNQRLRRLGEYEQRLAWGLDWKAYTNDCSLGAFGAAGCGPNGADVSVHPVSLSYTGQWQGGAAQAGFNIGVVQNVPGGAHGRDADFVASRPQAESDYHLLKLGINAATALGDWQASASVNAQLTEQALVSGEQFGLGGASVGRGFAERAITGDAGYAGSLELYTPDLGARLGWPLTWRLLGFYDFGHTRRNHAQPGDVARQTVASAGAGMRLAVGRNFSLRLDYGRVIEAGASQRKGDSHTHLSAVFTY